ncbi:MAG: DUF2931 family protein [Pseudomonadota bacterium]
MFHLKIMYSRVVNTVAFLVASLVFAPALASAETYEWYARSSAPQGYLAEFVYADLAYGDGQSIYVPSVHTRHIPWGGPGGLHIVGPESKAVPHALSLAWMSFNENKLYAGRFDLPASDIRALFQSQGPNGRGVADSGHRSVIVGVAPYGAVSVWVQTNQSRVLVATFTAQEADIPFSRLAPNAVIGRDDYVDSTLKSYVERHPEMAEVLQKPVPDYWSSIYLAEYRWRPVFDFPEGAEILAFRMETYNGEMFDFLADDPAMSSVTSRAVPRYMRISWRLGTQEYRLRIEFNDFEVLRAFQYASEPSDVTSVDFVISPELDEGRMALQLSVGSGDRWAYLVKPSFRWSRVD